MAYYGREHPQTCCCHWCSQQVASGWDPSQDSSDDDSDLEFDIALALPPKDGQAQQPLPTLPQFSLNGATQDCGPQGHISTKDTADDEK
jgi:hypothetical protein